MATDRYGWPRITRMEEVIVNGNNQMSPPPAGRGGEGGWGKWWIAIVSIAALFAVGTSILSWDNARASDLQPRFHWPDEMTNWYFMSRVAAGESLAVPEPRNVVAGNLIHPRTANVRADGALVPGAYLGMPLWYGLVGRVFGARAMLFLTPLLAALGLIAFATIVARLAGRAVGVIATVLLAMHPALWLFTATAMLPNVPFVAVLTIGLWVLVSAKEHPNAPNHIRMLRMFTRFLLGGLIIGFALTFRTHEIVWVIALTGLVLWWQVRSTASQQCREGDPSSRTSRDDASRRFLFFIFYFVGISLPFVPILILNAQLYGSPFTTGYSVLQEGGALPTEFVAGNIPFVGVVRAFIAPFGWHPIEAFGRFWRYVVVPYWWFIALAGVGLMGVLRTGIRHSSFVIRHSVSTIGIIVLTVWLILFYGSWTIADPLVRETNILTISYTRYWVPIIVLLAPWAAIGFVAIARRAGRWRYAVAALVLLAVALTSTWQSVRDPLEGLVRQRQAIGEHRARVRAVLATTPQDAIIVSHRMDKVFFPERAVVYAPETLDADFTKRLTALLDVAPVYWYAPSVPPVDFATLEFVGAMPFNELLYRVRAE